ncbi:MAG: peptidase T [Bacilli bacterium]|nr:peptidase T [Bacilli bacterium]
MDRLEIFIRYVKIDTQSDDTTGKTPSTEKQKNLGVLLVHELLELGLTDAHMDEWGNVYGHLPGKGSRIGLNAHMDTALEVTGANVKPHLIKKYLGGTIKLANGLEMSPEEFPILNNHIGHDLVVTDGNTLLGADDKAGIAIIMNALRYYHDNPDLKHSNISVCFTVDEEIGEGPLHFDYRKMKAKYAYTIDGSDIDKIECENFNAYGASITFKGVSIHPGEGKNKLVNAINLANEFINNLPQNETPFESEGKQGFFHITSLEGNSELATLTMIIRDFKDKGIEKRVDAVKNAVKKVQQAHPTALVEINIKKQYVNMRKYVDRKPMAIKRAKNALKANGINPSLGSIRGGTDGATFSKNGLITPNLGTGSYNHHGRFEFLDVQEYEKMIDVVIELVK